ncbi:MAG: DMT family transporter [bacterium]|nr:DMT family transporter [bacterium]
MASNRPSAWRLCLLLTPAVLCWSGNLVIGRGLGNLIPPITLNVWRWLDALIILIPVGLPRVRAQKTFMRGCWKQLFTMSIPSIAIFNAFIHTALQSTTATNTAPVDALSPIFIALVAWLIIGERLGIR